MWCNYAIRFILIFAPADCAGLRGCPIIISAMQAAIRCAGRLNEEETMSMNNFDDEVLEAFLANQLQLFPEEVATSPEEADEFLDEVCALVGGSRQEALEYLADNMDVSDPQLKDLEDIPEVFAVGDGRFLIVEG